MIYRSTKDGALPAGDHSPSALDVVIEAQVLVLHPLQDGEGLVGGKVLKLNQAAWPFVLQRIGNSVGPACILVCCTRSNLGPGGLSTQHSQPLVQLLSAASRWTATR